MNYSALPLYTNRFKLYSGLYPRQLLPLQNQHEVPVSHTALKELVLLHDEISHTTLPVQARAGKRLKHSMLNLSKGQ